MKPVVYLVGIGMGDEGTLTFAGRSAIEKSTVVIGAKRMLEAANEIVKNKHARQYTSYLSQEIRAILYKETFEQAAVLLSGDVGFYSGAKKLLQELKEYRVELIPGITSMVYFCSRLKMSWEDMYVGSAHGNTLPFIPRIARQKRCFFLLDGQERLDSLCDKLIYYGMEHVILHVGERLSYPDEMIRSGSPKEIKGSVVGNLVVVVTENDKAQRQVAASIPDGAFIRDAVPMTKSEVRTVSIGKLQLTQDAICYDIGAGSGSVSIEIAVQSPDIQVYAIEKKETALELIEKNRRKFKAENVQIVAGTAPDVLKELPAPTHVFIGGTSGRLEEIVQMVFEKNRKCRLVINTIALNSIANVMELLEKHKEYESEIVQMQTSVAKKVGSYQLMMGQNPIYIITLQLVE